MKSKLKKTAHSFNRNKFKQRVRELVYDIKTACKRKARRGEYELTFSTEYYMEDKLIAARYLRRHTDLDIRIEDVYIYDYLDQPTYDKTLIKITWR